MSNLERDKPTIINAVVDNNSEQPSPEDEWTQIPEFRQEMKRLGQGDIDIQGLSLKCLKCIGQFQLRFLGYIMDIWSVVTELREFADCGFFEDVSAAVRVHVEAIEAPDNISIWNELDELIGGLWSDGRGTLTDSYYRSRPTLDRFCSVKEVGKGSIVEIPGGEPGRSIAKAHKENMANQLLDAAIEAILRDLGQTHDEPTKYTEYYNDMKIFSPSFLIREFLNSDMTKFNIRLRAYFLFCFYNANRYVVQQGALEKEIRAAMDKYDCIHIISSDIQPVFLPMLPPPVFSIIDAYAHPDHNIVLERIISLETFIH